MIKYIIGIKDDKISLPTKLNSDKDEVETLYPHRYLNSLNTVGYKELFGYLDGEYDLNEAIRLIQKHTRVYARKQLTWFQRDYEIHWFQPDQVDKIINYTLTKINR